LEAVNAQHHHPHHHHQQQGQSVQKKVWHVVAAWMRWRVVVELVRKYWQAKLQGHPLQVQNVY
jgi:hypothetical protein